MGNFTITDSGTFDFFTKAINGGFNGYVCYEMCSPLRGGGSEANLDLAAKQSLAKIREGWPASGRPCPSNEGPPPP